MSFVIICEYMDFGGENGGLCVREVKVVRLYGPEDLWDTLKYKDLTCKIGFSGKKRFLGDFEIF